VRTQATAAPRTGRLPIGVIFLLVWLPLGVIGAVAISALDHSNQRVYRALNEHGVSTQATVTRTRPSDHDSVSYEFTVNGEQFTGSWTSDPPNPSASELSVGGPVFIVYNSEDPTTSCACDPRASASSNVWWRLALDGLFISSVWAVVITAVIARKRKANPAHW
jgi:hypothetical protein